MSGVPHSGHAPESLPMRLYLQASQYPDGVFSRFGQNTNVTVIATNMNNLHGGYLKQYATPMCLKTAKHSESGMRV
jgi:hypothetical protein